MRKFAAIALVSFTSTLFALSGLTQPRPRPRRVAAAAAANVPPMSEHIAVELAPLRWGMTHEQVLENFRVQIRASYVPRMKNLGQVEQYRLVTERQREIRTLEATYVVFDGAQEHRQWDSSFVGGEYFHNANESMLVRQDARGNREFFFFSNDHLWKRVQARNTNGAHINYDDFATQLEALFGPGRRVMSGTHLDTVEWRDATTHLHIADYTTFFSAFCLIYEDEATRAQLPTLRAGAEPNVRHHNTVTLDVSQPNTGAITGDGATDIADRITGKIRVVQNADAGAAAATSAAGAAHTGAATTTTTTTTTTRPTGTPTADDPLGLGGLGI